MRVAMIGTGYVGLVSGVCFSDFGHDVICVDKDAAKIEKLERGETPIYEPGLEALMAKNVAAGRLSFTLDLKSAVAGADAVFIAVGTPTRRGRRCACGTRTARWCSRSRTTGEASRENRRPTPARSGSWACGNGQGCSGAH